MYELIYADPPWKFDDALPGKGRGAVKHYQHLSVEQIVAMKPETTENAVLFLWRVSALQQEALDVVKGWGFEVGAELVWVKTGKEEPRWKLSDMLRALAHRWDRVLAGRDEKGAWCSKVAFGMGHYVRYAHETCLICFKGKRFQPMNKRIRSVLFAPVREHSRKPDEMYDLIETMYPGLHRLEMFARTRREGWDCLGDEVGKF